MAAAAAAPAPDALARCHGTLAATVSARPSQCCSGRPVASHAPHAAADSADPFTAGRVNYITLAASYDAI
jgi:hypothetical protein